MFPNQIQQNRKLAVLRYNNLRLFYQTTDYAEFLASSEQGVIDDRLVVFGTDRVINIPELGRAPRETFVNYSPKLIVTFNNSGTAPGGYGVPIDLQWFQTMSTAGILYDGTGQNGECYDVKTVKYISGSLSEIRFPSTVSNLGVVYTLNVSKFENLPAFTPNPVAPVDVSLFLLTTITCIF